MHHDKEICKILGIDYACANKNKNCRMFCSDIPHPCYHKPTYGDLHRAKDIINERGEWLIDDIKTMPDNCRGFDVLFIKTMQQRTLSL